VGRGRLWAYGSGLLVVAAVAAGCQSASDPPPPRGVSVPTQPSGPTRPASRPTAPGPGICATPGALTGLSVTRTDAFPQNQVSFVFPDHVSATNAADVAAVARAACRQPVFPAGDYSCPADLGITYALAFEAGSVVVGTVTADPTGCTSLTGLGPARSAGPSFWGALAVALGLPAPREYCDRFRGHLPGSPTQCGPLL
jgi:hypothetical protein